MKALLYLLTAWRLVSFTDAAHVLRLLNFQGRVAANATNLGCARQSKVAFMINIISNGLLNHLSSSTFLKR